MEIQAPPSAYAFMSMDYLKLEKPENEIEVGAEGPTELTEQPDETTAEEVTEQTEPESVVVSQPPPVTSWPEEADTAAETETDETGEQPVSVEATPTVPSVQPPAPIEELPPRIVYREGRVVEAMSIQAPSRYALMSLETKRLINFLHTEKEGLNLKAFAGKDVRVKGEELLDARWSTPLIEVEDIRLSPK
jgi:hypothetical protein